MTGRKEPKTGSIRWVDLTVRDAAVVRDFYRSVVGWEAADVDMGGYFDYNMSSPEETEPEVGICHARGVNANLPAQWLIYISVEDMDRSLRSAARLGGEVVADPVASPGESRYAVIKDPAGAVAALYQGPRSRSEPEGP